jgi:hypothetical protein
MRIVLGLLVLAALVSTASAAPTVVSPPAPDVMCGALIEPVCAVVATVCQAIEGHGPQVALCHAT